VSFGTGGPVCGICRDKRRDKRDSKGAPHRKKKKNGIAKKDLRDDGDL